MNHAALGVGPHRKGQLSGVGLHKRVGHVARATQEGSAIMVQLSGLLDAHLQVRVLAQTAAALQRR